MKTKHRRWLLGAAISIVAAGGCLHHAPMVPCATAPGESACWESARIDDRGRIEHHVVERVIEGDACDTAVVEQTSFLDGKVSERVKDTRRCDVVDHRVTDRYDLHGGRLRREIAEDLDHDDQFGVVRTHDVALSLAQRLFATTTGWQRLVRLQERLPADGSENRGRMVRSRSAAISCRRSRRSMQWIS